MIFVQLLLGVVFFFAYCKTYEFFVKITKGFSLTNIKILQPFLVLFFMSMCIPYTVAIIGGLHLYNLIVEGDTIRIIHFLIFSILSNLYAALIK